MFLHLRLHTEFSVVDGTNRIDEVVAAAAAVADSAATSRAERLRQSSGPGPGGTEACTAHVSNIAPSAAKACAGAIPPSRPEAYAPTRSVKARSSPSLRCKLT